MKRYLLVTLCVAAVAATASAQKEASPADTTAAQMTHVKRIQFTTGVVEKEPQDDVDTLTTQADEVLCFTEIVGMEGTTIEHRWMYGGEVVATVPVSVEGPRWRAYSKKKMSTDRIGTWTVAVYGPDDNKIAEDSFEYGPEDAATAHTKEAPEKVKK